MEELAKSLGIDTHVIDPVRDPAGFESRLADSLENGRLTLLIARRSCILAAPKIRQYEAAAKECEHACSE